MNNSCNNYCVGVVVDYVLFTIFQMSKSLSFASRKSSFIVSKAFERFINEAQTDSFSHFNFLTFSQDSADFHIIFEILFYNFELVSDMQHFLFVYDSFKNI